MAPPEIRAPQPDASVPPEAKTGLPFWKTIRQLTRHHWLYLPRLFSRPERIRLGALLAIMLATFGVLSNRLLDRVTVEKPAVGGVLREGALSEPRFINPIYASSDTERDLSNLVFSKLISYDADGTPVMDLAEDVAASPDGRIYTVRLKPDLRWHDGEAVSADDVVFTVKTIQDPEYQSPLRPNWIGVAVEKLNEATIRFTLRQPYAPFLENLALGIVPEHLWRKIPREAAILSDLNLKPVGTGPYRFKKFIRREDGTIVSLELTRNRNYHGVGPYLREIRFSFYPDEPQLIAAYRRDDIDAFAFISTAHVKTLERLDTNIHELELPKLFGVFFNPTANPALGRKPVRQALAMAIDRELLVRETLAGGGAIVNTAIPPGTFGAADDIAAPPYDPAQARSLLERDGWKATATGSAAVLERTEGTGRNRKTIELVIRLVTSDAPELADAALRIADMWQAAGVKTEVSIRPLKDLETSIIRPRAYEALLFGEVFGHDPDPFAFWHTSQLKDPGLNIALYSNRAVDQLLEEARRTSDTALRAQKYREFQQIVRDDTAAIFLYRPLHYYVIRRGIQGVEIGAIALTSERFNGINRWYMDTQRALK